MAPSGSEGEPCAAGRGGAVWHFPQFPLPDLHELPEPLLLQELQELHELDEPVLHEEQLELVFVPVHEPVLHPLFNPLHDEAHALKGSSQEEVFTLKASSPPLESSGGAPRQTSSAFRHASLPRNSAAASRLSRVEPEGALQAGSCLRTQSAIDPTLSKASAQSLRGLSGSSLKNLHSLRPSEKSVRVGFLSHVPDERQSSQRCATSVAHASTDG